VGERGAGGNMERRAFGGRPPPGSRVPAAVRLCLEPAV